MAKLQGSSCFQPSIEWTQDAQNYELRLQLPGFRKDELSIRTDGSGKLTVKGNRSLGDGNYMRLDQVFEVPKDSHSDKIKGKFDGGCLSLFIPKKVTEQEVPVPLEYESRNGEGLKDGSLETIIKNTNVIAAAVLAFSVGFHIALKLRSSGA